MSLGGDADTQAAIAGSIATASEMEIPMDFAQSCNNLLPDDFRHIIDTFPS